MPVPDIIPPVQEGAIATFPAEELASGLGIVEFYGVKGADPSGVVWSLTEKTNGSFPIETQVNTTTTAFTFTSPKFNLPRYIKGTGYVIVNLYIQGGAAMNATCKIQHWDGTTPTDLTGTGSSGGPAAALIGTFYVELPITTEKMVKKGEMIRAVITVTDNGNGYIGHCPANTASASFNTQGTRLTVGVPFRRGE